MRHSATRFQTVVAFAVSLSILVFAGLPADARTTQYRSINLAARQTLLIEQMSTGAMLAALDVDRQAGLSQMASARGLFQRAIPQSGAAHNVHTRETATVVARQFLEELGIAPSDAAAKLRSVPADQLLDTHRQTVLKLGTSAGRRLVQPASAVPACSV